MIERKTTLILGAGASKPYGLPLGSELRDILLKTPNLSPTNIWPRKKARPDFSLFCQELSTSGYGSVDAFLENREEWSEIGKFGIACNLLAIEKANKLFPPNQPKDHWLQVLWSKIAEPDWKTFKNNKLSIITFNYDRLVEHYLSKVVSNHFKKTFSELSKVVDFVHIHGDLGDYEGTLGFHIPKESMDYGLGAERVRQLRTKIETERLKTATANIKIVHESNHRFKQVRRANKTIHESERIYFIGFGYNKANMNKFTIFRKPDELQEKRERWILGTHKGIDKSEWSKLCKEYKFHSIADDYGSGTISSFLNKML